MRSHFGTSQTEVLGRSWEQIAQSVKSKCQLCKLQDVKLGEQEMGRLPEARPKPAPPFTYILVGLFGQTLFTVKSRDEPVGKPTVSSSQI